METPEVVIAFIAKQLLLQALDDASYPSKRRSEGRARRSRGDGDSGDEDVMAGAGPELLGHREAYKSAEQVRQEIEMRQASREEVKAVLRTVLQLSAGEFYALPCLENNGLLSVNAKQGEGCRIYQDVKACSGAKH